MRLLAPRLAVAGLVTAALLPTWAASPAQAEVTTACDADNDQESASANPGRPYESLRLGDVQDWFETNRGGRLPGDGVTVAVLDSGVNPVIPLVAPQIAAAASRPAADYFHGTAVAGIIAGPPTDDEPIGIAPGARVLDVKIYDDNGTDDSQVTTLVSAQTVFAGLEAVEAALPTTTPPIRVVNLSVAVEDDPGVEAMIKRLYRKGVVVVAASGNRPGNPDDPLIDEFGQFKNGENAADTVFPAAYDDVVAAATTIGGLPPGQALTNFILQNTAIDVAVPTSGALSYNLAGQPCVLKSPATSWAAAEVSGILAVLASAYPDENPKQLVTRLESTATGRDDVRSPLTGAGVVQPYAAVSRALTIARNGELVQTRPVQNEQRAELPPDEVDPLVSTRDNMVWFGIVGGGVLVLALVLRPVLARRRHP